MEDVEEAVVVMEVAVEEAAVDLVDGILGAEAGLEFVAAVWAVAVEAVAVDPLVAVAEVVGVVPA